MTYACLELTILRLKCIYSLYVSPKNLVRQVLEVHDSGRDPVALWSSCNYSREELQAVHQVRWSRSEHEKLGLDARASR